MSIKTYRKEWDTSGASIVLREQWFDEAGNLLRAVEHNYAEDVAAEAAAREAAARAAALQDEIAVLQAQIATTTDVADLASIEAQLQARRDDLAALQG